MIEPVSPFATALRRTAPLAALVLALVFAPGMATAATLPAVRAQATPLSVTGNGLAATQFRWLLARMDSDAHDLTADEISAHFTARFVDAVGADTIITQLQAAAETYAPFTIVTIIQETDDLVHVQALARDGTLVVIALSIEHSDEKIAGFIFQPGDADEPFAAPASSASSPVASPIASPAAG